MKRYEITIVKLESVGIIKVFIFIDDKPIDIHAFNKKDRSLITRITKFIAENIKDLKE